MQIALGTFDAFADRWKQAFRATGVTPHQSPGYIRAESCRRDIDADVAI